jgi:hypothetical protein
MFNNHPGLFKPPFYPTCLKSWLNRHGIRGVILNEGDIVAPTW